MVTTEKILITGATGTQGTGSIQALLSEASTHDITLTIHALVRDPSSENAQALAKLSPMVKLFKGDFEDVASIKEAAEGCTGLFMNVTPQFTDPVEGEKRHGHNVITAAKQVDTIKHIVYSTVTVMGNQAAIDDAKAKPDHFMAWYIINKKANEEAVQAAAVEKGWGWTLLRPGNFFTNYIAPFSKMPFPDLANERSLIKTAMSPEQTLPSLDPGDIGRFVARILCAKDKAIWNRKIIPLASINVTTGEMVKLINGALEGKKAIEVHFIPEAEAKEKAENGDVFTAAHLFLKNYPSTAVDVDEVRSYGIPLGSWEEFAAKNRDSLQKAVGL